MHFEKIQLDKIQNGRFIGHYSLSHGRYLVNRARWLDHYYKTKCEISDSDYYKTKCEFWGEDAP